MTTVSDGRTESAVYYDPYDAGIVAQPYPVYARLREEAPLYYNEEYDFWALSRHSDVEKYWRIGRPSPTAAATSWNWCSPSST
jgi:cytochrome P450